MTFADWVREIIATARKDGVTTAAKYGSQRFALGGLRRLDAIGYRTGTSIYECDWDILVILDACRADLMREVAIDYGLEVDTHRSPASMSPE